MLDDPLDRAVLAGPVAPLQHQHDPRAQFCALQHPAAPPQLQHHLLQADSALLDPPLALRARPRPVDPLRELPAHPRVVFDQLLRLAEVRIDGVLPVT